MTNPASISEALREALAKVSDDWTLIHHPTQEDCWNTQTLQRLGFIERAIIGHVWKSRRTAAGRALMEGEG